MIAAVGCTLGTLPHVLAAITGLAALLHTSAVAFQIVKYAGVAYLLYMAWATWRDTGALAVDEPDADVRRSVWSVLVAGVTLNLLNPKLTVFFFAVLPQFVPAGDGAVPAMLTLSAVFMAMTFAVFAAYGIFAAAVREHVLRRPRVLDIILKVFAATFAALAGRLALESR